MSREQAVSQPLLSHYAIKHENTMETKEVGCQGLMSQSSNGPKPERCVKHSGARALI